MGAPKFATLHSGLLARKGEARPAQDSPFWAASYADEPMDLTPVGQTPKAVHATSAPNATPCATASPRSAAVRISARHKHLLMLVKLKLGQAHTALIADALESHLTDLAKGGMAHCGCFKRLLVEAPVRNGSPSE